jgi:hypothetical protein
MGQLLDTHDPGDKTWCKSNPSNDIPTGWGTFISIYYTYSTPPICLITYFNTECPSYGGSNYLMPCIVSNPAPCGVMF